MIISATFMPKKWDEKTYAQLSPHTKLTRTQAEFGYSGGLQGNGAVEYLMFYSSYDEKDPHKATAEYAGLIRFEGSVEGKSGSCVIEERGAFADAAAKSTLRILPGSGTGELAGIAGGGTSLATPKSCRVDLDIRLP
ncbi:MAG TPA: DUF3224 domain-containing protein [Bacteroidota bacterium]|nr:DUF3224 domain-containing protein [Bacteroidota bacterium]